MPDTTSRVFDEHKPVIARHEFQAAGRMFRPGEVFDWRRLAITSRRVGQMYEAGKLSHEGDTEIALVAETDAEQVSMNRAAAEAKEDEASKRDDDLAVDSLAALQEIAREEGVEIKRSKDDQREAIILARDAAVEVEADTAVDTSVDAAVEVEDEVE